MKINYWSKIADNWSECKKHVFIHRGDERHSNEKRAEINK